MDHQVVSREEWTEASKRLLAEEKQFTKARDRLNAARQALPWVKVEKPYRFETADGTRTLAELFEGRSQLIVYHFMWRWDLGQGCVGCSFLCDHIDGANQHLAHHDVTLVAVSRGRLADLEAYRQRMGWKFKFASSYGSDFNYDYHVSFTPEEIASRKAYYNFETQDVGTEELPGISVFCKDEAGNIFHTYSSYARGNEELLGAFVFLDLTPKGRNEKTTMDWVRRHDEYEDARQPACCHGG
jgi:predicted dithiol-disulfide oxidoreductase (DUF899 family)